MVAYIAAYGTTAVIFFSLDLLWLSFAAKRFYFDRLGPLLLDKPLIGPAVAFYALYVTGIVYFAVAPAMKSGSAATALINGALFGFFAYATYDLSNYATLKNWSLTVSLVDIVWGTALTGLSAWLGYLLLKTIFPQFA